ncbi:hypothetical protein KAR28_03025 [Candidatus Parcubacteria bacterium]|nr:hypothetical protein [Candidatus Parcubacteria bacterium]
MSIWKGIAIFGIWGGLGAVSFAISEGAVLFVALFAMVATIAVAVK